MSNGTIFNIFNKTNSKLTITTTTCTFDILPNGHHIQTESPGQILTITDIAGRVYKVKSDFFIQASSVIEYHKDFDSYKLYFGVVLENEKVQQATKTTQP